MKTALPVLTVFAAAVLAVATIAVDPMGSMLPETVLRLARALAVIGAHTAVSVGGGAAVAQWLRRRLRPDDTTPTDWLTALMTGWLVWGLVGLPLAAGGAWSPSVSLAPGVVLGGLALTRPHVAWPDTRGVPMALCAVVAIVGLIDASAPPIDTDELYQHLALPGRLLRTGDLPGGVLHPDGSRPQLLTLLVSPLLAFGTDTAPRLLSTVCGLGILLGTDDLVRRTVPDHARVGGALAGCVLIGSYTFLHDLGLAANNLPTALAVLATVRAGLAGRLVGLVVAAGVALSFKYTAAGAMVGIWLVLQLPLRTRVATGMLALLCVAPWWIRNALEGLHPLFPYAGWGQLPTGAPPGDLTFQYLDKYGAGRRASDLLLLPWNAVMTAEIGSFRFLGRITPLLLLLGPLALGAAARTTALRRLVVVSTVICVAWAAGPHWLRHLLPGLPVLAATVGAGAAAALRRTPAVLLAASSVVLLAGAPSNWAPVATHLADRLPVALGQESRAAYLSRAVRSADAVAWLNEHLPEDATVAILYEWPGHLIERRTVLGSVEDHVPTRYWLLVHEERSLAALRDRGVTHLVVGRFRFLRKWYPFLSDTVFEAMFEAPTQRLEALLLTDATLVFERNHTRVYRIDPDSP